jgi:hypothetical protein
LTRHVSITVMNPDEYSPGARLPLRRVADHYNRAELVVAGFDAGIALGESIQRDMVAVRVSGDQRLAVLGSPEYFASHPSRALHTMCCPIDASTCAAAPRGRISRNSKKTVRPSRSM